MNPDHEKITASVTSILERPNSVPSEFVAEVSAEYFDACEEVNRRLTCISGLLRKGLRAEAIQECEREPNVLDAIALLDIPDPDTWIELHQRFELVLPPGLLLEHASELSQAYLEHGPLESLLKKHRLLALGHAPIRSRIRLLREISARDPDTQLWQDDIAALEKARLAQIATDAREAFVSNNLDELLGLADELASSKWLVEVPPHIPDDVDDKLNTLTVRNARCVLEKAEAALSSAHAEFDVERGRAARFQWRQYVSLANLDANDPLIHRAATALEWLQDQDKQEEAERAYHDLVDRLEALLDDESTSRDELEQAFQQLARLEQGVPDVLRQRYANRIRHFEIKEERRHRLMMVGVIGLLAIVAVSVTWVIRSRRHHARIADAVQQLKQHHNARQWSEALRYSDRLAEQSPSIFQSAEVETLRRRIDEAIANDRERSATFTDLLDDIAIGGYESRDWGMLIEVRKLALSIPEKSKVAEIEQAIQATEQAEQEKQSAAFQNKLKEIQARLAELEADNRMTAKDINALRVALSQLQHEFPRASDAVRHDAKVLETRLSVHLRDCRKAETLDAGRRRVTDTVGDVAEFSGALEEFSSQFENTPTSRQIYWSLAERPIWETVARWQEFCELYFSVDSSLPLPRDARAALEQIRQDQESWEGAGTIPELLSKLPFLEGISSRVEDSDGSFIYLNLVQAYRSPLLTQLFCAEDVDPKTEAIHRYYFSSIPKRTKSQSDGKVSVECLVSLTNINEKEVCRIREPNFVDAPQTAIATEVTKAIEELDAELARDTSNRRAWEQHFAAVISTIHSAPKVDPLLRFILLRDAVRLATEGSHALAEGLSGWRQILDTADVDVTANWLLPHDPLAENARDQARLALRRLPNLNASFKRASSILQQDLQPVRGLRWIGWLSRDERDDWKCWTEQVGLTGTLMVAAPDPSTGKPSMFTVGTIASGTVTWDTRRPEALVEGRPIYLQSD